MPLDVNRSDTLPPMSPLDNLRRIRRRMLALREAALAVERVGEDEIALVHPSRQVASRNLVDYLAVRQQDSRDLQYGLYGLGLSALGVLHRHVMASINAVLVILDRLCGEESRIEVLMRHPPLSSSRDALEAFADDTLGRAADPGLIRIMVTMPSEAADDPALIESLMEQGMSIMRVNCAHDGPESWLRMVENLRLAETRLGRRCRVAFDLAGPKLRSGPIVDGPETLRFKPKRDRRGRSTALVIVQFGPVADFSGHDSVTVPLDPGLCSQARPGDALHLKDARGRRRVLTITEVDGGTLRCTCDRTNDRDRHAGRVTQG